MYRILVMAVLLAGCSHAPIPVQPAGPTDTNVVQAVETVQDKVDDKVAAAVVVARENLDKPHVVDSELGVALSLLDKPSDSEIAVARLRAEHASPADYDAAKKFGAKLLASLDDAQTRLEDNQREAARISMKKDTMIADLQRQLDDANGKIWTILAALMVLLGGLAVAFLPSIGGKRAGFILVVMGFATGVYSKLLGTAWFIPSVLALTVVAVVTTYIHLMRKPEQAAHEEETK